MSERSRRASREVKIDLPEHVREGLTAIVEKNVQEVAEMLEASAEEQETTTLVDMIAKIMSTQRLSAATILGRFFSEEILSEHAIALGKSGKGNAATLADRYQRPSRIDNIS
jgi:hypothetical protein